MITTLLIVAILGLATGLGYESFRQRQDIRIYRSLLAEESAMLRHCIKQLQHHAVGLERAEADTRATLMFVAWRLGERGVLTMDDAPADDIAAVN